MKKTILLAVILLLISFSLTGCIMETAEASYATNDEVQTALEERFNQKVTFIEVTKTENGKRYWNFKLENYPDKVFETTQRKNVQDIFFLGDATLLGYTEEPFDKPGYYNNVSRVLMPDIYDAFLLTLTSEEPQLETAIDSATQLYIRINEKEDIDIAFDIINKFEKYIEEQEKESGIDLYASYKLKKDFRNPTEELIQSVFAEQDECVTLSFSGTPSEKIKNEFLKRWDDFEAKMQEDSGDS